MLIDEADGEFLAVGTVVTINPYTTEELDSVYFTNQDKYGILAQGNHPPLYITIRKDGSVISELIDDYRIPDYNYKDVNSPALALGDAFWTLNFPASWKDYAFRYYMLYDGVVASYDVSYTFDGTTPQNNADNIKLNLDNCAIVAGLDATFTVTLAAGGGLSYDIAVTGADSGRKVECRPIGSSSFIPIQVSPLVQENNNEGASESAWSYPTYVLASNGRYYKCILTHQSAVGNSPTSVDSQLYWEDLNIGKPPGFDYQYPDGSDWAEGVLYSPRDRGFPTVCAFHQQRLILMANKDNPTALYGSAIGNYSQFTPGPNDDDPWIFVLDSDDSPQIKWANSDRQLMLGTSNGEWLISADVTITPTDISAERQNAARSHLTRPVQVDNEVFYIEQGLRKLRGTRYVRDRNANVSSYVSVGAEHLIATDGINRIIVQHVPEVMITMITTAGQAVVLSYEKDQQVIAFTPFETDGKIYDACTFFTLPANRDDTYYSILRNNNYVIEKMRYPCSKVCTPLAENGLVYTDGWVRGQTTTDSAGSPIIEGLGHLEGKEVHVLVDDAWQIGTFIVTGGVVSLNPEVNQTGYFAAGLPYEGDIETFEIQDNFQGTGLGTKRRWLSLTTRLYNSALPNIYTVRARDRTPATPMGKAETVREGIQDVTQARLGFGDGKIRIIHDRPYPLHLIGFFGEYQIEDR